VDEALQAREERIESAIHLIRTLKSVNDTSLSDWEGVIGDELSSEESGGQDPLAGMVARKALASRHTGSEGPKQTQQ
jgi:hypothetical protein